ncbi:hypothetical protein IMCC3317_23360 [Kordia antarctica]|uniref:Uncharacterized protein n=1 Tax=Kordia antarctica TaxID=1218801 RepID=A0A7L4ZK09_9FLAO|nr:hypothetical protein IMCC3317_23360 [Kordia antarctica]
MPAYDKLAFFISICQHYYNGTISDYMLVVNNNIINQIKYSTK